MAQCQHVCGTNKGKLLRYRVMCEVQPERRNAPDCSTKTEPCESGELNLDKAEVEPTAQNRLGQRLARIMFSVDAPG